MEIPHLWRGCTTTVSAVTHQKLTNKTPTPLTYASPLSTDSRSVPAGRLKTASLSSITARGWRIAHLSYHFYPSTGNRREVSEHRGHPGTEDRRDSVWTQIRTDRQPYVFELS